MFHQLATKLIKEKQTRVNMAGKKECSFTSAMALSEMGISSVPQRYILPPPQRPILHQEPPHCSTKAPPIIDLSALSNPTLRSGVIKDVHWACKEIGIFQVSSQFLIYAE